MGVRSVLFAGLLLASVSPAQAQQCARYEDVVKRLQERAGEMRIGSGIADQHNSFELWVNPETGSFTILHRDTWGKACVRAAGQYWRRRFPHPRGKSV